MAVHAERLERTVEERIARLQIHAEHVQADLTEIKTDMRDMKTDIRRLEHSVSDLRLSMERSFTRLMLGAFALAASLLGVMAKGFGWIN
jgi:HAMP domain-containing protein